MSTSSSSESPSWASYVRGTLLIAAVSLVLATVMVLIGIAWAKSYSPEEVTQLSEWIRPVVKTLADPDWLFMSGIVYTMFKIFILWFAFFMIGRCFYIMHVVNKATYGSPRTQYPDSEE